jgi:hypothetical protein
MWRKTRNKITTEPSKGCGGGGAVPTAVADVLRRTWVLTMILSSTELMLIMCSIHFIPYVEINSE